MKLPESILRPVKLIRGGIHLEHQKSTAECETLVMPAPKTVYIPVSQHIGAPANPVVKKGHVLNPIGGLSAIIFFPPIDKIDVYKMIFTKSDTVTSSS